MRTAKLIMLCLLSAGCASSPSGGMRPVPTDRRVITAEEILPSVGTTAYDVISQLRPEYLRSRGRSSLRTTEAPTAMVYVDNVQMGNLDALRNLAAHSILRVEYLGASDATTRFGTDHTGGAIIVYTKR